MHIYKIINATQARFAQRHITVTPLPSMLCKVSRMPSEEELSIIAAELAQDFKAVDVRIHSEPGHILIVYQMPVPISWMIGR